MKYLEVTLQKEESYSSMRLMIIKIKLLSWPWKLMVFFWRKHRINIFFLDVLLFFIKLILREEYVNNDFREGEAICFF